MHLAGGGGITHPIAHDIFFMTNFFLGETKIKKNAYNIGPIKSLNQSFNF